MKHIITETNYNKISILRRADEDWTMIQEIVDEGVDMDDPCDFRTEEKYLQRIVNDSTRTYLYHFIYDEDENFDFLFGYFSGIIRKKMSHDIIRYYREKKEDC